MLRTYLGQLKSCAQDRGEFLDVIVYGLKNTCKFQSRILFESSLASRSNEVQFYPKMSDSSCYSLVKQSKINNAITVLENCDSTPCSVVPVQESSTKGIISDCESIDEMSKRHGLAVS